MKLGAKPRVIRHSPVSHGGRFSGGNRDANILDFSSNISPAGMPPGVRSAVPRMADAMGYYPDAGSQRLVSAISGYVRLPASNIVAGNGAVEILYNFCTAFLAGRIVLIPAPTFGEYEAATCLAGGRPDFFHTMDLAADIDSFVSRIPRNGCVFVCNPNNPTGTVTPKRQMAEIVRAAEARSSLVFVDECFVELVPGQSRSVAGLIKKHDNLFVLRSLTKSFGLAGIRAGYGIGHRRMTDILRKIKIPWSVNALAQEAGVIAIRDRSHIARSNSIIRRESDYLRRRIDRIPGFECYDSQTNFILIRTEDDSARVQKRLLRHGILVRDCSNFRGLDNHHIRIAIRPHRDNQRLVAAMEAVA